MSTISQTPKVNTVRTLNIRNVNLLIAVILVLALAVIVASATAPVAKPIDGSAYLQYRQGEWSSGPISVSNAKGLTFDSTFTKWVTTMPPAPGVIANMSGIVGGAVGPGTYTGEILSMKTVGNITSIRALYHFNGSLHSFTADLMVTQDDSAGTATLSGRVTDGWLKGASVTGEYNVLPVCPVETPDNAIGTVCFQGALHVHTPK